MVQMQLDEEIWTIEDCAELGPIGVAFCRYLIGALVGQDLKPRCLPESGTDS